MSNGKNRVKVLTQAQQNHLYILAERLAQAQQALQFFIAYLRIEHMAPEAEGWELMGFEAFVQREEGENGT